MSLLSVISVLILTAVFGQYNCERARACRRIQWTCIRRSFPRQPSLESVRLRTNEMCEGYERAKACAADCFDPLFEETYVTAIVNVFDYLCNVSRRARIHDALQSDCLNDTNAAPMGFFAIVEECGSIVPMRIQRKLSVAIDGPNDDTMLTNDVCQPLLLLQSCIVRQVQMLCGKPLADIIEDVTQIGFLSYFEGKLPTCAGLPENLNLE